MTLNWSPPKKDGGSPITSYKLEISEDGKTWTPLDITDMTKYTAKGLKDGQKYYFRVSAINDVGEGELLVSDVVIPKKPIGNLHMHCPKIVSFSFLSSLKNHFLSHFFFSLIQFENHFFFKVLLNKSYC